TDRQSRARLAATPGRRAITASAPDVIGTRTKPLPTEAMNGEPNDANASALVCSGCCAHAPSPQAPPGGNALRPHSFSELREGLTRLKVLLKAHREDADALQAAVLPLVYQALDGAG